MIYYHFLKFEHAIDDLNKQRIRVSAIDSLNDPFELKPKFVDKKRELYNRVRKGISKKWGLLCFSEDWRIPLLWGHYADKHQGIALGFEIHNNIRRVEYVSEREKLELTSDDKENEKLFLNKLGFKKQKGWEYEKEHRMWVELKNCQKDVHSENNYIKFNDNVKIKEIILGCRFDYRKKADEIKELARKNGISIIIPSREEWSGFRINPCGTKQRRFFQDFKKETNE